MGLRVSVHDEVEGLDVSVHGETVYYGSEDLKPPVPDGLEESVAPGHAGKEDKEMAEVKDAVAP